MSHRHTLTSILEAFGMTPMIELVRSHEPGTAAVFAKAEFLNPGGSVKDRIALAMIEDAEKDGLIKPGSTVVEPTSGNTGIGLAMACAVKGYRCIITMPDSMSLERIYILEAYGAKVILTPGREGMKGAIKKAEEIVLSTSGAFMPQQFNNKANPEIHRRTTALEVLKQMQGRVDAFVVGVGTGGTITGVGQVLRKECPSCLVVAAEPAASPVLSGGKPGTHKIQGIGAGFVPAILDRSVIDEVMTVGDEEAYHAARDLARKEGILCGISSGASLVASFRIARRLGEGKRVVTVLWDRGERYFSTTQYFEF
jgi:cysteine synthase A